MKRKQLVVIYTNEYSTPIAAIFKQIASKRNCKGHTCKSEVFESLLLLPTPNCNCCQQKAQNLLQAVMKQNISHLVMYFPAWVFTFQFHFLAKTSPLNSLPAVTTKPAPICHDKQCHIPIQIAIMKKWPEKGKTNYLAIF